MTTATLNPSMAKAPEGTLAPTAVPTMLASGPGTIPPKKAAVLVGLLFLIATFTFAIGNALIHSYFASSTAHNAILVAGVFLLACDGVAVAGNGVVMRRILMARTPKRSQAYCAMRVAECLTAVTIGVYFLTSHTQWGGYVLAVYALSGAAGLILSSALLTSRIVPRNLSMLGVVGYPVFLVGSVLAMFNVIDVTHGAGMLALVPSGLFELALPIRLFTKGFTSERAVA